MMSSYTPKADDYFTIEKWTSHHDNSWVGALLRCNFVEGPLIRCVRADVRPDTFLSDEFTLDIRRVVLMPLSPAFVERTKWKDPRAKTPAVD